jgi:hypothetical protein
MFVIMELPYGTLRRRERKSQQYRNTPPAQVENIMICIESC